jgi:hypothetical protein
MPLPPRPGPAKVRHPLRPRTKELYLVELCAARARALVEKADVLSEGESVELSGEHTYFGTTSLLLRDGQEGLDASTLELLVRHDPHLRTYLLRLAAREAATRLGALPIGPLRAELRIERREASLLLLVELAVPLLGRRVVGSSPT